MDVQRTTYCGLLNLLVPGGCVLGLCDDLLTYVSFLCVCDVCVCFPKRSESWFKEKNLDILGGIELSCFCALNVNKLAFWWSENLGKSMWISARNMSLKSLNYGFALTFHQVFVKEAHNCRCHELHETNGGCRHPTFQLFGNNNNNNNHNNNSFKETKPQKLSSLYSGEIWINWVDWVDLAIDLTMQVFHGWAFNATGASDHGKHMLNGDIS